MKLVDTLDEQAFLEAELERTKPPVPPECRHLHYLLASPFRYGRYPGNSRFRREGYSPGVFYASERAETAVAETAFYRLLFFAESPGTSWPANPLEFTAFVARFEAVLAIDLTAKPLVQDVAWWSHPTNLDACLALADAAREAGIEAIRYRSVRDRDGGTNIALMSCRAFAAARPSQYATWRLSLSAAGVTALSDRPARGLQFTLDGFAADERLSKLARRAKG
jgi:hypothetical protein